MSPVALIIFEGCIMQDIFFWKEEEESRFATTHVKDHLRPAPIPDCVCVCVCVCGCAGGGGGAERVQTLCLHVQMSDPSNSSF